MSALETFEKLLASGKDSVMLRYGLGNEYLKAGRAADAVTHLNEATRLDPGYSAAWKLLGKALAETGAPDQALMAYRQGVAVAESKGDIQAAKEMKVFAKRIEKLLADGG
jgi:predicted Zn-dependent protease